MAKKADPILDERVARGNALRAEIAERLEELHRIEQELVTRGPGQYQDGEGHTCTAVAATPAGTGPESYMLRDGEEVNAKAIAGDCFPELFERKVTYIPKPGLPDRADALLTPAKKRDLLALCLVPGKAKAAKAGYVIWK